MSFQLTRMFPCPSGPVRFVTVGLMGICALGYYAPSVACAIWDGVEGRGATANLSTALVVPLCLVGGALCYALHFPERLRPGFFDKIVSCAYLRSLI